MVGNPYNSSEAGLGPLMRDVKNKICQDCELIALLEDDNGMELLVNNKIISLDLPVKLVCSVFYSPSHVRCFFFYGCICVHLYRLYLSNSINVEYSFKTKRK